MRRQDEPTPSFRPDLRSWEPSPTTDDSQAGPARTIGIFAVGDAPQTKVPRHAVDEDEPETPKKRPNRHRVAYQAVEDSMVDELDPIDEFDEGEFDEPAKPPRVRRAPAKVRTAPESRPVAGAQDGGSRQSGLVIVLALVAASVAITASLLWGLHHHSTPSVGVTSLDNVRPAPSFGTPGRDDLDRSRSSRYPDPADSAGSDDLDSGSASDPDLDDSTDPKPDDSKYDPNADSDLDSAKQLLKDRNSSGPRSSGLDDGTGRYGPDLDGSAPSYGSRNRPPPRDYPDDPGYSRGPSRSGPGLPGLGGL